MRHDAYIGLGSNLGDREGHLRAGVVGLAGLGTVRCASAVFESEPVGGVPQPWYLNMVVRLATEHHPHTLLNHLLAIELGQGRVRTQKNGPRTLDLDLLLWDEAKIHTVDLIVPHPRLHQRRFVLEPLAEIHPNLAQLPGLDWGKAWQGVQRQTVRRLGRLAGLGDSARPGGIQPVCQGKVREPRG